MKKNLTILMSVVLVAMLAVSFAGAQVTYDKSFFTSYQVVNLGTGAADIVVTYYDADGMASTYQPQFNDVAPNGSVTVQQALEDQLGSGRWSAVISSNQPIAAIANQQLGDAGSGVSTAPFSSYTGASSGATEVILPAIMHNWFGYDTEVYVQNVGSGDAADVSIEYIPTSLAGCATGSTGQSDTVASASDTLAQYAAAQVSQADKTALGASSVSGCEFVAGRFLGSAKVTADQPVAVVVNQATDGKLFTYNGFTSPSTNLVAPAYMRDFFGFYASISIYNPSPTTDASVDLTYSSDSFSFPANTSHTATRTVPAGESITLYDGPGATDDQSDLDDSPSFDRFFGSITLESNVPIFAVINQEAVASSGSQGGSYNAFAMTEGSQKVSIPLVQSDFFGFFTSITIQTVDGTQADLDITYTSDSEFSAVTNASKTYSMSTNSSGFLNRFEGASAQAAQSDLLDDSFWESGGDGRFIGSATIEVTSGSDIVVFVNSESNSAPEAGARDSLYTYNAFNIE